jgi:hypothetical protein
MNDERPVKIKAAEAGSYSMDTESPAQPFTPSTEQ